jgi:hypothetical protein
MPNDRNQRNQNASVKSALLASVVTLGWAMVRGQKTDPYECGFLFIVAMVLTYFLFKE